MNNREKKSKFNFGSDFYRVEDNENNNKYDTNDYQPQPKRFKEVESIIVKENDDKGKIVELNIDVGLSHAKCKSSNCLTKDRLFINKIDNNNYKVDDDYDYSRHKKHINYTHLDNIDRMYRLIKFIDRADFHSHIDEVHEYKKYNRYYHFFNRLYTCKHNCKK